MLVRWVSCRVLREPTICGRVTRSGNDPSWTKWLTACGVPWYKKNPGPRGRVGVNAGWVRGWGAGGTPPGALAHLTIVEPLCSRAFARGYAPITPPSVRRMAIVAERGRAPEGPSGQELTAFGFFGSLRGG
jgi:hypothetical protein